MAPNLARPHVSLRGALDRDVYQVIKKLEVANGKPFKSVSIAYEAVKRSNSSLSRQKKRPLEDALDRVLQLRQQELADSSDSEAELDIDDEPGKPEDDRFLLNRQMTKHWNVEPAAPVSDTPAKKKRRVETDDEDRESKPTDTPQNGLVTTESKSAEKTEKTQKKSQRSTRHTIEDNIRPPLLGGLDEMYRNLLRQTAFVLRRPEVYWRRVPGILLSGPPGIGKKSLIRTLAADLGAPIVSLAGCFEDPERMEKSLTEAVDSALAMAPSIVLIEDLDLHLAKPGGNSHSENHQKALRQLSRQMQRIQQHDPVNGGVLAMATTSRLTDIDPAALHLSLFERTIAMRIPDRVARHDILQVVLNEVVTNGVSLADDVDIAELSKMTHGFVGADIVNVVTLAQQVAVDRLIAKRGDDFERFLDERTTRKTRDPDDSNSMFMLDPYPPPNPEDSELRFDDFRIAIKGFTPSLRKEGFTVVPNVTWDQVGALQAVRDQLHTSIIGPIRDPELYAGFGLQRPAGALLWGPPGCGKTLVAQAVANEAQASFILINGPELLNKYVGESERAVRELFQRARSSTPCILFFDEMDSLVPRRDSTSTDAGARIVNALLTELDGAQDRSGIYIIGTTNRPDMIDEAMLRPGRLSVRLYVDLPTVDERVDILTAIYKTCHAEPSAAELERLPQVARDPRCNDFSGADLGGLHTKAAECALKRWVQGEKEVREIDSADWEQALATTQRSVMNPEAYRKLNAKLGKAT